VVSAGLLAGGALAGFAAAAVVGRRLLPGVALGIAGAIVGIGRAGRRPPWRQALVAQPPAGPGPAGDPTGERLTFSILIPARDEAVVLPALVADIARQDHRGADGTVGCELIVIDDRSVDGTAGAALAAAAAHGIADRTRVIRRDGPDLPDGKGAALTAAQPAACGGDFIVVLDADARIGPAFLSRLAAHAAAGHDALTARRRILDADSSVLARCQADEQTLDGAIQVARWNLGGCPEFRGDGIVIRRELLAAVGGWRAEALTEDLDLSSRIAIARGIRVLWAGDAETCEEPVRAWSALWRQRQRWAEGALRRSIEHGPAQLRSPALAPAARLDFALYAGQLAVPPIVLGAVAGAVILRRPWATVGLLGAYLAFGTGLAWEALHLEPASADTPLDQAERLRRAVAVGLFNAIWLAAVPGALIRLATRRGPIEYAKMAHVGGGDHGGDRG
jgi:1,2-diacylglycerol 3-beta-glucosyltransferase